MIDAIEWISCGFGLAGAFLVATNSRLSKWGWICFLMSNVGWICYAVSTHANGLLLQQLGFTATSMYGIKQWWLGKRGAAPSPAGN